MLSLGHSFLCFVLLFFHSFEVCLALELKPIRHPGGGSHQKRDNTALDLRNDDSFLWGTSGDSEAAVANFTVYTPGDSEHILSMERFDGMLKSVDCSSTAVKLQFKDDDTLAYAQRVWDWVNGADNHTFLMVASPGNCGNNTQRIPYLVKSIKYDEKANIANLAVTIGGWKELAKSYEMTIGHVGADNDTQTVAKRYFSKDASFSLANEFPFGLKVEKEPLVGELECEGCKTTGSLHFELTVTQNVAGIPNGVKFSMSPKGVSAVANLKLGLGSNFGTKLDKEEWKATAISIPLEGFTIPEILSIGPFLDVDVGFEITGLEAKFSLSAGATCTLSDSAILKADLLNPSQNQLSGWMPHIDFDGPDIEAQVSATLQMFFMPAIKLKAEVLDEGVETGLDLKLPFLDLKLEAESNPKGGVCDDPKKTLGLSVQPYIGVELKFTAGTTNGKHEAVDVTIATTSFEMGDGLCWGINPDKTTPTPKPTKPSSKSTTTLKTSTTKKSSTTSSAPIVSCTANNGLHGTCISTKACQKDHGVSEPGHCPGGNDIQCCYQSDGTGDSCKISDGRKGICMSTKSCSNAKSESVPGFCKGPADMQCCVPKKDPPETNKVCTLPSSNTKGECISTSSCQKGGGNSTPGLCPGDKSIQCCTYGTCFVGMQEGYCQPISSCKGSTHAGLCGGGASIQCCTE